MKIGLAKEVITPPLPTLLSGFAAQRKAESVHDDVYVKVALCENENRIHGAISYDLVGFDHLLLNDLKLTMKRLGLEYDNFMIAATHTHSAQGGMIDSSNGILKGTEYIFMPTDAEMIKKIVEKTGVALKNAIDDLKDAHIYVAKDQLHGIGSNRNHQKFKGNDDILVVYIEQLKGKKAILVNFACHPTVLNQNNVKISADFPGALDQNMFELGYEFSMFLNGSCGDISTRFTREKTGFEEVKRYGKILSDKILDMKSNAKEVSYFSFKVDNVKITLNLKKADPVKIAEKKYNEFIEKVELAKAKGISGGELRIIESHKEGATANLAYAKNAMDISSLEIEINIFKINNDVFIGVPGELFSELTNDLQNESVHFVTYQKGYNGYFADEYAYDNYYYEALSSPFEKGQSEKMISVIKEKIKQI